MKKLKKSKDRQTDDTPKQKIAIQRILLNIFRAYRNKSKITKVVTIIVPLVSVIAGILTIYDLWNKVFKFEPEQANILIVLDHSGRMGESFAEGTRLKEAQTIINFLLDQKVYRDTDNLSFRRYGGNCEDNSELIVEFGQDNVSRLRKALENDVTKDTANLVVAFGDAVEDFNKLANYYGVEKFKGVYKKIYIISGGLACVDGFPKLIEEAFKKFSSRGEKDEVIIEIIPFGATAEERAKFAPLDSVRGMKVTYAESSKALLKALYVRGDSSMPVINPIKIIGDINNNSLRLFKSAIKSRGVNLFFS